MGGSTLRPNVHLNFGGKLKRLKKRWRGRIVRTPAASAAPVLAHVAKAYILFLKCCLTLLKDPIFDWCRDCRDLTSWEFAQKLVRSSWEGRRHWAGSRRPGMVIGGGGAFHRGTSMHAHTWLCMHARKHARVHSARTPTPIGDKHPHKHTNIHALT